jgi:hypothetical protein
MAHSICLVICGVRLAPEDQERLTDRYHLKRSLGRNYPGKSHDHRHSQIGFAAASPLKGVVSKRHAKVRIKI